ncbi:hypothetical protein QQ045_029046 [Rhodiola kirilowii]
MSRASFSYQKLEQQQDHDETSQSAVAAALLEAAKGSVLRARAWTRLRRVPVRRRIRVRGWFGVVRLKRFLRAKKVRMVRSVKGSWEKVVRRVRESQAHFGDLFAGNYLLLQVNPTPLKIDAGVRNKGSGYCKDNGGGLGFVGDSKNPRYYDLPKSCVVYTQS